MDKQQIIKTLKTVRDNSNKRNFKQSVDLIINLKDIDLKKQDNKVDIYVPLHFDRGKKVKICGLVGAELIEPAKKAFDTAILSDDFQKYKDKKQIKKLADEHSYFVAQANMMAQVATVFGRVLGPRAKMPNPKAGCVVPPNANLAPLVEKLKKTVRVKIDTNPVYQTFVGTEDMSDEQIADNVMTIYTSLTHALPNDIHNIKDMYVKLTMGKAEKITGEAKSNEAAVKKPGKKPKAQAAPVKGAE